ncbi:MAG: hypothetical protein QG608_887 [Actinomycetota bacterium]|nr:hypothetical protein [Actinomycetota bacterium]
MSDSKQESQSAGSEWFKSSFSGTGNCVEIRVGEFVLVRDSKHKGVEPLRFTRDEWGAFIDGAKSGEFDLA